LDYASRSVGTARSATVTSVFAGWELLVGSEIASHATPHSLREDVLVIMVDHPAWATQLRYMSSELLDKIRSAARRDEIKEIRFRVLGEAPERRPKAGRADR
jgi:predicted nucleic acid-binding Zn ribbon protein